MNCKKSFPIIRKIKNRITQKKEKHQNNTGFFE